MNKTLIALTLTLIAAPILANTAMDNAAITHAEMQTSGSHHSSRNSERHNSDNNGEHHNSSMNNSNAKMDHSTMAMSATSAVGMPAHGAKADKVGHVLLSDDMQISFKKEVSIAADDVVQFVVMNSGQIEHEFTIGSPAEQLARREMMKSMTSYADDNVNSVLVQPGKAKQIVWHFHGDNQVELACNIPGHSETGMVKLLSL